jgi:hypothetical protein
MNEHKTMEQILKEEGKTFVKFDPKTIKLTIEEGEYGREYYIETPYSIDKDGNVDWERIYDYESGVYLNAETIKKMETEKEECPYEITDKNYCILREAAAMTEGYYMIYPDRGYNCYAKYDSEDEMLDYIWNIMKSILTQNRD